LIAIATFGFFVQRSIRLWREHQVNVPPALIPLLSLLVFNLGQRESWLQGFQTLVFLGIACVVVGYFLLAEGTPIPYGIALLLGLVSTYSMVNGLLYWPIGLVILFINAPSRARTIKIILWVIVSSLAIGLFLAGWTTTATIDPTYLLAHLPEWLIWILNFLGAPLLAFWYVAWIFGVLSIGLYVLILWNALKGNLWKSMIPYLAIGLFILITALSISLGRMEFGLRQSTVSRYLTMSVWYWASLMFLLPFANLKQLHLRLLYLGLTASLVFLTIAGGWVGYVRFYQRILPAYQAVTSGQTVSDDTLSNIYPYPNEIHARIDFLRENKLSAWSEIR
jgi:hypothetical protein